MWRIIRSITKTKRNCNVPTSCRIQYLVKGVNAEREDKSDLHQEIVDALPNVSSVNLLQVVEGFSLDLEFSDIEPFSKASFEPYLSEQILLELINLKCETIGSASLQLVRSEYS